MINKTWRIEETEFDKTAIEQNGSRFLVANGYMGYRGTLEEFRAPQLTALNLAGLFDRNGDSWRESVNAPNPLYTYTRIGKEKLDVLCLPIRTHRQQLDFFHALHSRETVFVLHDGTAVSVRAERFASLADEHILAMRYEVTADTDVVIELKTGLDGCIWDINGPHLNEGLYHFADNVSRWNFRTLENRIPLSVYETICMDGAACSAAKQENGCWLHTLRGSRSLVIEKICAVYWGEDTVAADRAFAAAAALGYEGLRAAHCLAWEKVWDRADITIDGDNEAQFALRYSLYHLNAIAPRGGGRCGIPARGLSGQVYKGASFWDTEMFMLPFFDFTDPEVARRLVQYRIHTLPGAQRKAAEIHCGGAFYAWESQETGDDACTLFNITDVFTKRPLRTYFRDKQIHISADVVYGLWEYCCISGDHSLLMQGGLEVIWQCVRFFYSYAYYKPQKQRYELLDVVGPDEYHERVNNNAYTNAMVKHAASILLLALDWVKIHDREGYADFITEHDVSWTEEFAQKLYVPNPDENNLIEQFDDYYTLEDVRPAALKKRELDPNEYWGCGHGLATTTRVLKQADVVMMLSVLRRQYSEKVKKANWAFYEPYTEHGSSLSACAYGIVAANVGDPNWAYRYFMKTATVDLTGATRQYLGTLYIGGTHPAANGGSWNTVIFGFAGVSYDENTLDIAPHLPDGWKGLSFRLLWKGVLLHIRIRGKNITGHANGKEAKDTRITIYGKPYML